LQALLADMLRAMQSRPDYYQKGIIIHMLLSTVTYNFFTYNFFIYNM